MKYKVTTTTADHVNGHEYSSARAALTVYNNIRALSSRLGYTLADSGTGHNCRAELWIKEGFEDRNIEICPVPDEDTTTPAEVISESDPTACENKQESRAARFWAVVKDYAAGTWSYIKPRAKRAAKKAAQVITRAAVLSFRVVWFAGIICATLATLAVLASNIADYVPAFFLLRLAAFFGCAAVASLVEVALIYISKVMDRATDRRLFAMPK